MFASGASKKKLRLFKIEKNQQQKTISAAKNRIKKLCFGDLGGGARRVRPPLNPPVYMYALNAEKKIINNYSFKAFYARSAFW